MGEEIQNVLLKIQKKLLEKLTIMFIPHGEEKIYSFHLSGIVILFLFFIFLLLFSMSYNAFLRYQEISHKIRNLKSMFGKSYEYTYQVQRSLLKVESLTKRNITKNLENLYKNKRYKTYTNISYDKTSQFAQQILKKEINIKKELAPGMDYLRSTYYATTIKIYLDFYNNVIKSLGKNIVLNQELYFAIPNGRPVRSNRFRDTSSYGIRLDPVRGNQLEFHTGMDMAGEPREPIVSTADGIVKTVYFDFGYGYTVVIQHPSHYLTLYAHLYQPLVQPDKKVKKGDVIGLMGATGRVTGTHLHYEVILPSETKVDPISFVCLGDHFSKICKTNSEF